MLSFCTFFKERQVPRLAHPCGRPWLDLPVLKIVLLKTFIERHAYRRLQRRTLQQPNHWFR